MAAKRTGARLVMSNKDEDSDEPGTYDTRVRARGPLAQARVVLAVALDHIVGGSNPRQASAKIQAEFGLRRRTADRYVSSALQAIHRDSLDEPIASKRARGIARYEHLYQLALERTRTAMDSKDADGVLHYHEVPDPDVRAATDANARLMQLEGVTPPTLRDEPPPPGAPQLPANGTKAAIS